MNITDSARRSARHYPGGLDAIALRLDKSPSTLEKELRGAPGYKLGAEDAAELAGLCVDLGSPHALDYAHAVAARVGATLMMLPPASVADEVTVDQVAAVMRECADVVSAVTTADADGRISTNEMKHIDTQWAELLAVGHRLLCHLRARHAAGVPGALPASWPRSASASPPDSDRSRD